MMETEEEESTHIGYNASRLKKLAQPKTFYDSGKLQYSIKEDSQATIRPILNKTLTYKPSTRLLELACPKWPYFIYYGTEAFRFIRRDHRLTPEKHTFGPENILGFMPTLKQIETTRPTAITFFPFTEIRKKPEPQLVTFQSLSEKKREICPKRISILAQPRQNNMEIRKKQIEKAKKIFTVSKSALKATVTPRIVALAKPKQDLSLETKKQKTRTTKILEERVKGIHVGDRSKQKSGTKDSKTDSLVYPNQAVTKHSIKGKIRKKGMISPKKVQKEVEDISSKKVSSERRESESISSKVSERKETETILPIKEITEKQGKLDATDLMENKIAVKDITSIPSSEMSEQQLKSKSDKLEYDAELHEVDNRKASAITTGKKESLEKHLDTSKWTEETETNVDKTGKGERKMKTFSTKTDLSDIIESEKSMETKHSKESISDHLVKSNSSTSTPISITSQSVTLDDLLCMDDDNEDGKVMSLAELTEQLYSGKIKFPEFTETDTKPFLSSPTKQKDETDIDYEKIYGQQKEMLYETKLANGDILAIKSDAENGTATHVESDKSKDRDETLQKYISFEKEISKKENIDKLAKFYDEEATVDYTKEDAELGRNRTVDSTVDKIIKSKHMEKENAVSGQSPDKDINHADGKLHRKENEMKEQVLTENLGDKIAILKHVKSQECIELADTSRMQDGTTGETMEIITAVDDDLLKEVSEMPKPDETKLANGETQEITIPDIALGSSTADDEGKVMLKEEEQIQRSQDERLGGDLRKQNHISDLNKQVDSIMHDIDEDKLKNANLETETVEKAGIIMETEVKRDKTCLPQDTTAINISQEEEICNVTDMDVMKERLESKSIDKETAAMYNKKQVESIDKGQISGDTCDITSSIAGVNNNIMKEKRPEAKFLGEADTTNAKAKEISELLNGSEKDIVKEGRLKRNSRDEEITEKYKKEENVTQLLNRRKTPDNKYDDTSDISNLDKVISKEEKSGKITPDEVCITKQNVKEFSELTQENENNLLEKEKVKRKSTDEEETVKYIKVSEQAQLLGRTSDDMYDSTSSISDQDNVISKKEKLKMAIFAEADITEELKAKEFPQLTDMSDRNLLEERQFKKSTHKDDTIKYKNEKIEEPLLHRGRISDNKCDDKSSINDRDNIILKEKRLEEASLKEANVTEQTEFKKLAELTDKSEVKNMELETSANAIVDIESLSKEEQNKLTHKDGTLKQTFAELTESKMEKQDISGMEENSINILAETDKDMLKGEIFKATTPEEERIAAQEEIVGSDVHIADDKQHLTGEELSKESIREQDEKFEDQFTAQTIPSSVMPETAVSILDDKSQIKEEKEIETAIADEVYKTKKQASEDQRTHVAELELPKETHINASQFEESLVETLGQATTLIPSIDIKVTDVLEQKGGMMPVEDKKLLSEISGVKFTTSSVEEIGKEKEIMASEYEDVDTGKEGVKYYIDSDKQFTKKLRDRSELAKCLAKRKPATDKDMKGDKKERKKGPTVEKSKKLKFTTDAKKQMETFDKSICKSFKLPSKRKDRADRETIEKLMMPPVSHGREISVKTRGKMAKLEIVKKLKLNKEEEKKEEPSSITMVPEQEDLYEMDKKEKTRNKELDQTSNFSSASEALSEHSYVVVEEEAPEEIKSTQIEEHKIIESPETVENDRKKDEPVISPPLLKYLDEKERACKKLLVESTVYLSATKETSRIITIDKSGTEGTKDISKGITTIYKRIKGDDGRKLSYITPLPPRKVLPRNRFLLSVGEEN